MRDVLLDYGQGKMRVEVPNSTIIVRYGETYTDPEPLGEPAELTRQALDAPLGLAPLKDMAGPGKKAVIAFPDRVKGGAHATAHRRVAVPMVIADLLAGGCREEDITLLCAPGLHRHNTVEDWSGYLGTDLVRRFWPDRIVNHDAEGPDLAELGTDAMGNVVQSNRRFIEADIPILIGHCAGNPYGGYSGGYKMLVTGLAGWRSIASHHTPKTMHRKDWLGASTKQHMRHQFRSIGEAIEAAAGKRFFAVDAVVGQRSQVLDVKAGALDQVEAATWPLADRRTNVTLAMDEPADVLLIGLPRDFHYGPGMGTNPILMSLAIGGQLSRCWHALRPGCVVIAVAPCDGWFNPHWFPSYERTYEAMQRYSTAAEFLASDDAMAITLDSDYRFSYSQRFAYHPFHAMSMIAGGSVVQKWTSAAYVVGARVPGYARGMGYRTAATVAEALKDAARFVGGSPQILCTPECFSGGVPVHLRR
jgi:nickel-dependent lactate racemase